MTDSPAPDDHRAAAGRRAVPGSEPSGASREARPLEAGVTTTVTLYLRGEDPAEGVRVSREQWAAAHGASDEDVAAVAQFAARFGLEVAEVSQARRTVLLSGPVSSFAEAFDVQVTGEADGTGGVDLVPSGALSVPAALNGVITAAVGLDERPRAFPRLRRHATKDAAGYSPVQVAEAYGFPSGDGTGQTVALIELGGGYRQADLDAYFAGLGLATPTVTAVGVDGATNTPGSADGPDGEVMLDIEVVGAVVPKATVAVYFTTNTDQGFLDAVSTAVHDTTSTPSVVSISWGGPESGYAAQTTAQMESIFTQAASLGVTVTAASGDSGSTDGQTDGAQHVDFPASAPHALACGGTALTLDGGSITSEVVWDDLASGGGASGGGVSVLFPVPAYQAGRACHRPPTRGARPAGGCPT